MEYLLNVAKEISPGIVITLGLFLLPCFVHPFRFFIVFGRGVQNKAPKGRDKGLQLAAARHAADAANRVHLLCHSLNFIKHQQTIWHQLRL